MPAEPTRHPWWSYLRLSVRGLIVLVLVIGGSLGWIVHSARVQREAVAAIMEAGGEVLYDWDPGRASFQPGIPASGSRPPGWLVRLIGVDYCDHVLQVALLQGDCSAALPHIRHLTQIRILVLMQPSVTDASLVNLEGLQQLEILSLERSNISDAGLKHLKGVPRLNTLNLNQTRISDRGLAELEPLNGLMELHLAETSIGDAGLAHLEKMSHLQSLDLRGTKVSDAGVRKLQQARPSLEIIR